MKTNYDAIKQFSHKLQELLKEHGMPLGLSEFPLAIKIDVDPHAPHGIGRLIKDTGCKRIMAVPGIDEHNKFTISFVALDEHNKVDARHHTKGASSHPSKAAAGSTAAPHVMKAGDPTPPPPTGPTTPSDPTDPIDGEETWPPDDVHTNNDGNPFP